eukprot:3014259-Rhodomonas_salina.1
MCIRDSLQSQRASPPPPPPLLLRLSPASPSPFLASSILSSSPSLLPLLLLPEALSPFLGPPRFIPTLSTTFALRSLVSDTPPPHILSLSPSLLLPLRLLSPSLFFFFLSFLPPSLLSPLLLPSSRALPLCSSLSPSSFLPPPLSLLLSLQIKANLARDSRVSSAISLRACSAMPGTHIAYAISQRACPALLTKLAYALTEPGRCRVLMW